MIFSRNEVDEAWCNFMAVGDRDDWSGWADLHTEDGIWVETQFGTFKGREAIRAHILKVMAPIPMMYFPVEWRLIEGNRVVYYNWQVMPDPKGGDEVYRFGCITTLEYAGNGLFSFQEDLYNPREGEACLNRWIAAGGEFAAGGPVLTIRQAKL
jgi:hypothetical protein